MSTSIVDRIAEAVLYEGYLLYPYRPSTKNRQRWTFGGVLPQAWCAEHATGDTSTVLTECLLTGDARAKVSLRLRFLHVIQRQVYRLDAQQALVPVDRLTVDATIWQTWQEAAERDVSLAPIALSALLDRAHSERFEFAASRMIESLAQADGAQVGAIERRQPHLRGTIELSATPVDASTWKLTVRVSNLTPCDDSANVGREQALVAAFVSAHVVLAISEGAEFASLVDPPEALRAAAGECRNEGLWPVLVGEAGDRQTMLAAPIILYDYPQIAPESPGDLFDGCEIDEILSLRIRTLADDELTAIRSLDPRARAMLERTESLDAPDLAALHGAMRRVEPSTRRTNATAVTITTEQNSNAAVR